ncbi:MAG TPA: biotin/lipoyl-binding protein, partial [Caldilineae bacterium]|nr:biotin/lipoyl-binding protein [Caldilineae bacterium]
MASEIIVPKMGQTVETVRLVQWLVKEGDEVRRGDPILEIETDKATFEVPAPASGVVRIIEHQEGEEVPVVTRVGIIAAPDEDISQMLAEKPGPKREEPVPVAEAVVPATAPGGDGAPAPAAPAERKRIFASPRARKRAREAGITDL